MNNSSIKRGDIFLFDFGTNKGNVQCGIRPSVILQYDRQNTHSPTTVIAPLTTELKRPDMHVHVVLGKHFGLLENSMVLLEQLRTINQQDLGPYIGHIDDSKVMKQIDMGLGKLLGIKSLYRSEEDTI